MPQFKKQVKCPHCDDGLAHELRREPIRHKHYVDHRIVYQCTGCGKLTSRGG